MPALVQAEGTQLNVSAGSDVSLPALTEHVGGGTDLQAGATVNAPALQAFRDATFTAATGAGFNAPSLTDVRGSTLNLEPGFGFTVGSLSNVDGARFFVSGGLSFHKVTATAMAGTYFESQTILEADGADSVLDLSALQSLVADDDTHGTDTLTVRAEAGGRVDLSNLDSVSTNNRMLFHVQSQSEIDLSSLQAVGSGQYEFRVEAEGKLSLGDFTVTNASEFNINDATSVVDVAGSLLLDNPSVFDVATGGGVSVGGNFSFATEDEAAFQIDDGVLAMEGAGSFASPQWLEVGGEDLGLPATPLAVPGENGNFAVGKLVIGQAGQSTVVELVDAWDNGNRTSFECLYLPGFGGDGMEMYGDSTLNIGSINVYAYLDNDWVHLNSLFTGGVTAVDFAALVTDPEADGTIVVPEPASLGLLAVGALALLRRRRD